MSDATVDVLEMQLAADCGAIEWTRIDAGGSADDALALASLALAPLGMREYPAPDALD
ncbi:MAG: hypothetical protein GIX02_14815 [Candidatus Eremiobacteraeota bacterium]|nr:hypothetical protein [Candidatus Eremiobacteraeota bacterium]